jgi:hypothetical protein
MQVHMLTKEVKPGVFPLPLGVYFIGFPFGAPLEVLFVFGFFFFPGVFCIYIYALAVAEVEI